MRLGAVLAGWNEGGVWESVPYRTGSVAVGTGTVFTLSPGQAYRVVLLEDLKPFIHTA